jgi:hypothetical protein
MGFEEIGALTIGQQHHASSKPDFSVPICRSYWFRMAESRK